MYIVLKRNGSSLIFSFCMPSFLCTLAPAVFPFYLVTEKEDLNFFQLTFFSLSALQCGGEKLDPLLA